MCEFRVIPAGGTLYIFNFANKSVLPVRWANRTASESVPDSIGTAWIHSDARSLDVSVTREQRPKISSRRWRRRYGQSSSQPRSHCGRPRVWPRRGQGHRSQAGLWRRVILRFPCQRVATPVSVIQSSMTAGRSPLAI